MKLDLGEPVRDSLWDYLDGSLRASLRDSLGRNNET